MNDSDTSLKLAPDMMVFLESYRINNSINASLHYLAMNRLADSVGACHARLVERFRSGSANWFEDGCGSEFFEQNGPELRLREEFYFFSPTGILDTDLRLVFLARDGSRRLRVPLNEARFEFFCRLLPRLHSHTSIAELTDELSASESKFVNQLLDSGTLCRERTTPPRRRSDYSVRLVGHSTLLLEGPECRVVVDPLVTLRYRPEIDMSWLFDEHFDAAVISHPHWDHFNLDSLLHMNRDCMLIIPELQHAESIINIDMEPLLRCMGFNRIVKLKPWTTASLNGIDVTATEFFGEGSGPESPQDWMTYYIRFGDRSIFGAVDSCRDSNGSMDDVIAKVVRRFGPVSILFSPASGFFYPISMFTRRPFFLGEGVEQFSGTPEDLVRWCAMSGADVVVPYAMFHFCDEDLNEDEMDRTRTGSIHALDGLLRGWPNGPLLILRPGACLRWSGEDDFHVEDEGDL